jgi:hypothetical protein
MLCLERQICLLKIGKFWYIKSRLTRPAFYGEPLTRRDDRLRIVFFRLFEKEVDRTSAASVIERYVQSYSDLRDQLGFDWDLAELRARLTESYPFRPDLLDVVFDRYATISQTQATRGALSLLAELVVREQAQADLLLPADVAPDTYYEWLSRVSFELTKRVLDDLESLAEDEDAAVKECILRTAFLYSLGEVKQLGAMEDFLPDVETIVLGRCLEVYSQHSLVTDEQDQPLTAREATREIHGLVGALLASEDELDADPVSTIFAIGLVSQDSLSFDDLDKMLQRGQSLASALFMCTRDETYKRVRRTWERLGRDVGDEVALQRRLL